VLSCVKSSGAGEVLDELFELAMDTTWCVESLL
jgi:hypothetical protein